MIAVAIVSGSCVPDPNPGCQPSVALDGGLICATYEDAGCVRYAAQDGNYLYSICPIEDGCERYDYPDGVTRTNC